MASPPPAAAAPVVNVNVDMMDADAPVVVLTADEATAQAATVCRICHLTYNTAPDYEQQVITCCGHSFGHACIERHLKSDSETAHECPVCQRLLEYQSPDCGRSSSRGASRDVIYPHTCGHRNTPATIAADEHPPYCIACGLLRLPIARRWSRLRAGVQHMRALQASRRTRGNRVNKDRHYWRLESRIVRWQGRAESMLARKNAERNAFLMSGRQRLW